MREIFLICGCILISFGILGSFKGYQDIESQRISDITDNEAMEVALKIENTLYPNLVK